MYNKVEICGVNTANLKVLSESEKMRLLKLSREGDKKAREELVNGNLRLVLSVIQRFTQRGENLDDLFQVGCIGLIKSIDNFDMSQNVRFSTTGIPPPPQVMTMAWSHSSRTAPISTIFLGNGEATTLRQPRPASSRRT